MSALPHGMANGPSRNEHLEHEDAQIWERPWSLEEIRQHSANWSLAADSGVSLNVICNSEMGKEGGKNCCDFNKTGDTLQKFLNRM